MSRNNSDSGRLAVVWLAAAVVVMLGAAGTGIVVMLLSEDRNTSLMIWGGSFAGLVLIVLLFNVRWSAPVNHLSFWLSFRERGNPAEEYTAARRRIRSREKYGNNQPPSVESVRDAANHGGAWVPRSSVTARRPGKS